MYPKIFDQHSIIVDIVLMLNLVNYICMANLFEILNLMVMVMVVIRIFGIRLFLLAFGSSIHCCCRLFGVFGQIIRLFLVFLGVWSFCLILFSMDLFILWMLVKLLSFLPSEPGNQNHTSLQPSTDNNNHLDFSSKLQPDLQLIAKFFSYHL